MVNEDPKKEAGDLKDPLHLFPTAALRETSRVLHLGAGKYGVYNWRESGGIKTSVYVAAILRHLTQHMDGEDTDAESGCSHLAHIIATCDILLDADRVGNLVDDRPKVFPELRTVLKMPEEPRLEPPQLEATVVEPPQLEALCDEKSVSPNGGVYHRGGQISN